MQPTPVTALTGGQLCRSDLAHAVDHALVPSGRFYVKGSSFGAYLVNQDGLNYFMDLVLHSSVRTSTVCLSLKPEGHKPTGPEFPPSNFQFDVDQEHEVAAAATLVFDKDGLSHQWLAQGDAGRDDVTLVQDPWNPTFSQFPREAFITVPQLREAVTQWAFGDVFPPPAIRWRVASEGEVGWL